MRVRTRIAIGLASLLLCLFGLLMIVVLLPAAIFVPELRGAKAKLAYRFDGIVATSKRADEPEVSFYRARDGAQLAYRFFDSSAERILIFIHGSSYHGAGYVALAKELSSKGIAKVYLPNLRGHYLSGGKRGDVAYLGQLEDDIADLIAFARSRGQQGPVILGGHSSGGGLAIRFAGGQHGNLVSGYLLLSPVILPPSPTWRGGAGWASADVPRSIALGILNGFHISAFNGLPVVWFNKPAQYLDGSETLVYSYRLNASMHPRQNYGYDIAALGKNTLVLVGSEDEQNNASAYAPLFARFNRGAKVEVLPGVGHLEIANCEATYAAVEQWMDGLR